MKHAALAVVVAFAGAALTRPVSAQQAGAKIDTSAKAVVAAAAKYIDAYQKDLAFVLADEVATQRVTTRYGGPIDERRTRAEFFLTYLPVDGTWIAVRDVVEVDGHAVTNDEDIRSLIQRLPLGRLATVLADRNARYNIGNIRRTFNEPTIGLLIANALNQRRFKFDRVSVSKAESPIVSLKFTERDRPTLVSGIYGEPVYSRGELDIEAATGCVERTKIELSVGPVRASLTTVYALDAKLHLWVPSTMSERYENSAAYFQQVVTVDTEYTNYRRFDSTVIIR